MRDEDPTFRQARRLVQALELEYRMRPTYERAQLVTRARQLLAEMETMNENERVRRGDD